MTSNTPRPEFPRNPLQKEIQLLLDKTHEYFERTKALQKRVKKIESDSEAMEERLAKFQLTLYTTIRWMSANLRTLEENLPGINLDYGVSADDSMMIRLNFRDTIVTCDLVDPSEGQGTEQHRGDGSGSVSPSVDEAPSGGVSLM